MESGGGVWHGMTIRDILEKVDLFNITTVEEDGEKPQKDSNPSTLGSYETNQDGKTVIPVSDPTSAYLGPKLWNNPISLPDLMDDDEPSDVMNMEEFLAENNIEFDLNPQASPMWGEAPVSPPVIDIKPQPRPSIIVAPKRVAAKVQAELPKGDNNFLYAESKRAKMEREKVVNHHQNTYSIPECSLGGATQKV